MSRIGFISLGCSKNLVDTEIMIGILKERGHEIVSDENEAEVIVINTCGFIDDAKEEAIATILEMAEKKKGKLRRLIVCGCLAQRYGEEVLSELPEVDCIVGVSRFTDIIKAVEGEARLFISEPGADYPEAAPRVLSTPHYTAYLKIAEGCSNHCTYCAIPAIRGPLKSRTIEDVLAEAARLAEGGVTELNIIAQDTTRFGTDIYGKSALVPLLEKLCEIEKIKWIRVLYTYPECITDELIDLMAKSPKIAKYFDIPLQHISDRVLKRMGRRSTEESTRQLLSKIRNKIPSAVIRTTFIVGFPGESSEDFEKLCEFIKWARFDKLGAFKFSPEEGTPAAKLSPPVHEDLKDYRYQTVMDIQSEISLEKGMARCGTAVTVLTEGADGEIYYGRTAQDAPEIDGNVYFTSDAAPKPGDYVTVKILKADEYDLIGEMVNEPAK